MSKGVRFKGFDVIPASEEPVEPKLPDRIQYKVKISEPVWSEKYGKIAICIYRYDIDAGQTWILRVREDGSARWSKLRSMENHEPSIRIDSPKAEVTDQQYGRMLKARSSLMKVMGELQELEI